MKTLSNQTLLYDEDCPLCNLYTSAFIKTKMLDTNGRKPFCNLDKTDTAFIDVERASNEIALIDTQQKTVIYGIDSLLKVLGNSMPWISYLGHLKPIYFLLKKLYSFISYNRKVIIPSGIKTNTKLQCIPTFNYKYRIFYVVFASLVTSFTLLKFNGRIQLLPESNFLLGTLVVLGQILVQSLFMIRVNAQKLVDYIGNLMTVSLFGSLLIWVILFADYIFPLSQYLILSLFAFLVLYMFFEHKRRVQLLQLPNYLSYTWLLYRLTLLILILKS